MGHLNLEIAKILNEQTRYREDGPRDSERYGLDADDDGIARISLQQCDLVTPLFRQHCRLSAPVIRASIDAPTSATLHGEQFDLAPYYASPAHYGLSGLEPELRFALEWPHDPECMRAGVLGKLLLSGTGGEVSIDSQQMTVAARTTVASQDLNGALHLVGEVGVSDPDEVQRSADRLPLRCRVSIYNRHLAFDPDDIRADLASLGRAGHLAKSLVATTLMAYGQQQTAPVARCAW